ncbi:transposase family protein [Streptomyces sp. Ag109_G2-15]|uniref:transposase family protein n=1 Tax=Streptomyces sp. Ag109_G2-15 TaxID=1938850 RepID=UPI00359C1FE9
MLEELLFPGLKLAVRQLTVVEGALIVDAAACAPAGTCPQCEHPGVRVHSRYWRHIAGLPLTGQKMVVRLRRTGGGSDRATAPFFDRGAGSHEDSRGGAWRPSGSTPLHEAATPWPTHCTAGAAQSTTRVSQGTADTRHRRVRLPQGPDLR